MSVKENRRHESRGPSRLARILAMEGVCLWLLCGALMARLVRGVPLAPRHHELLLFGFLPGLAVLGLSCGAVAVRLGARRWGWFVVVLNGIALLLMAVALAICLYRDWRHPFTL